MLLLNINEGDYIVFVYKTISLFIIAMKESKWLHVRETEKLRDGRKTAIINTALWTDILSLSSCTS